MAFRPGQDHLGYIVVMYREREALIRAPITTREALQHVCQQFRVDPNGLRLVQSSFLGPGMIMHMDVPLTYGRFRLVAGEERTQTVVGRVGATAYTYIAM